MKTDASLRSLLTARARELRKHMTPAERILWVRLRGRRFAGYKFRRQQPILEANAIADFYCPTARLVVELDGETHVGRDAHDAARLLRLEAAGLTVLRFPNPAVYDDLPAVEDTIWAACSPA
jgi:very-short-patch-repair endonuclease